MHSILTIYRKELKNYLGTPYGWVVLGFVLLMQGLSLSATLKQFEAAPQANGILYFILNATMFLFYFLFIFPLITMKSMADEEKTGTLESLLTAPIRTYHVILGKYFATFTFYMLLWLPMLLYPSIVELSNSIVQSMHGYESSMSISYRLCDWLGAYSILFLVGAWFCSIGILCSSLTNSQIISGIVTTGVLVIIYFLGQIPMLWGEFQAAPIFHYISTLEHIERFSSGLIDSRPFIFYITATVLTLVLTVRIVDHRRWRH